MEPIKYKRLIDIADKVNEDIRNNIDFFNPPLVVFPDNKTMQWFKSYYLKNSDDILMNIKFTTINKAIVDLFYPRRNYTIINQQELTYIFIKIAAKTKYNSYILDKNGEINPIRLFDLANKLASLYLAYDIEDFHPLDEEINKMLKEEYHRYLKAPLGFIFDEEHRFKNNQQKVLFVGFTNIDNLYLRIIDEYLGYNDDTHLYLLEADEGYIDTPITVINAPSKLREIEAIHGKICELLKDKNNNFSDFLVIGNNIADYENIIPQVFKQDNKNFPDIPYVINYPKSVNSDVGNALIYLFDIAQKGYYTRLDFINFINSPVVKEIKKISDKEIEEFQRSISEMVVYNNLEGKDDWNYAKKRLLLSKISNINDINENIIELGDKEYIPHSNISLDDDSIIKFVKVIDELNEWIDITKDKKFISSELLNSIKNNFDNYFSIKDKNEIETNHFYTKILKCFDIFLDITPNSVPFNTFFYFLIASAKTSVMKTGECFINGVTFTNFNKDAVLSAKYIFFIGCNSTSLPSLFLKDELDDRGDDYFTKLSKKEKEAFDLTYQNATKEFYISYLNKNLEDDDELYVSTLVLDLQNRLLKRDKDVNRIRNVEIDEKREWSYLFTSKEFKDKEYYMGLFNEENKADIKTNLSSINSVFNELSTTKITNYLKEPLSFKAGLLFGVDNDYDEEMKEEYEPFNFDYLESYQLIGNILEKLFLTNKINKDEILHRFDLENRLPVANEELRKASFNELFDVAEDTKNKIEELAKDNKIEIRSLNDLKIKDGDDEWVLTSSSKFAFYIDEGKRVYIPLEKDKKGAKLKDFLKIYVISLMDIALIDDTNNYNIVLYRELSAKNNKSFEINSREARNILTKIYQRINDKDDMVLFAVEWIEGKDFESYEKMVASLYEKHSPWSYFEQAKLFDYDNELGYEESNFQEEFKKYKKRHAELIKIASLAKEAENNG